MSRTHSQGTGIPGYLPAALCAAGGAFWLWCVSTAQFARMGDLGLAGILGWQYAVALVLVIAAFFLELRRGRLRTLALTGIVVALVVVLFGTASAVEPLARVRDAWYHAGFVQYIAQHGTVLPQYDVRFSWPGAFSLGALLDAAMGTHSAESLLRWAPLVFELLYLAPLRVIARSSGVSERTGWIGTALFYAANWIEQDYFSPQALNMLFFLVVLAVVFAMWSPKRRRLAGPAAGGRAARLRQLAAVKIRDIVFGGQAVLRVAWRTETILTLVLVLIILADVASHQLTPVALFLALACLYATRRLPGPELPLIVGVFIVAWLSFAATDYWAGHLSNIFGGVGDISSSLSANVGNRVTGSAAHQLIVDLRIFLSGSVFALALVGFRRQAETRSLELLALCPFTLLLFQSYGGEAILRSFLYSLPFAALLAAGGIERIAHGAVLALGAARRSAFGTTLVRVSVETVVVLALAALMVFVRGGNDPYTAFSLSERAAVLTVYGNARPGDTLAAFTGALPWRDQKLGEYHYVFADPQGDRAQAQALDYLKSMYPQWIILTESQRRWGTLVRGWSPDWESNVERALLGSGYHVFRSWSDAVILRSDSSTQRTAPIPAALRRAARPYLVRARADYRGTANQ